jgi:hypothetical protein
LNSGHRCVKTETEKVFCDLVGEIIARVVDRAVAAPAGSFVFVPRGMLYVFRDDGTAACRVLAWTTPGSRVEPLCEELARLSPGPPDKARVWSLLQKYDSDRSTHQRRGEGRCHRYRDEAGVVVLSLRRQTRRSKHSLHLTAGS